MHWNVQWGGKPIERAWGVTAERIIEQQPDVLILSEGPNDERIDLLCRRLWRTEGNYVSVAHEPQARYWFKLAVASRWPVRLEERVALPNGTAINVAIDVSNRPVRVLVVDGMSNPRIPRTPMLRAVSDHCTAAARAGRAVDVVAGDFNALARSVGFDALRADGYVLASTRSGGWHGTYPAIVPMYDVDHVWLGNGLVPRSCRFVTSIGSTNHRGQVLVIDPN
jgi:endonuclease/exonuclease/phosphatase family metal-dependent hydrolase